VNLNTHTEIHLFITDACCSTSVDRCDIVSPGAVILTNQVVWDKLQYHGFNIPDTIADIQKTSPELSSAYTRVKIQRLKKKIAKLSKDKQPDLITAELVKCFVPNSLNEGPTCCNVDPAMKKLQDETKEIVYENRHLKRSLKTATSTIDQIENRCSNLIFRESILLDLQNNIVSKQNELLASHTQDLHYLEKENAQWNITYSKLTKELDNVNSELEEKEQKLSKFKTRNVSKKLKRRDVKINEMEKVLNDKEVLLLELSTHNVNLENDNTQMKSDKLKLQKRLSYVKTKLATSKKASSSTLSSIEEKMKQLRLRVEQHKA